MQKGGPLIALELRIPGHGKTFICHGKKDAGKTFEAMRYSGTILVVFKDICFIHKNCEIKSPLGKFFVIKH